jgi:flagellar hook-associated protein FlgK
VNSDVPNFSSRHYDHNASCYNRPGLRQDDGKGCCRNRRSHRHQNAKAGEHWASLADDLQNAIVARLADLIAEDGAKVSFEIDSVELANSLQSAAGTASSKLVGQVNISHDTDNTKFDSYELTVTFEQAGPFFLPNTDLTAISTDSKDYYDAMIAAFADHIVTKLE